MIDPAALRAVGVQRVEPKKVCMIQTTVRFVNKEEVMIRRLFVLNEFAGQR